jgi:hypothetical protein
MELLGIGNEALRRIPTHSELRIDITALRGAIADNRAAGYQPAYVIATAGTVNTGAIDDPTTLARLKKTSGYTSTDASVSSLRSPPTMHIASAAWRVRIPSPSTLTNGCTHRLKSAALLFATPLPIEAHSR